MTDKPADIVNDPLGFLDEEPTALAEKPALAGEAAIAEEPAIAEPVAVAEEPTVAGEPTVAEEPAIAEKPVVALKSPASKASSKKTNAAKPAPKARAKQKAIELRQGRRSALPEPVAPVEPEFDMLEGLDFSVEDLSPVDVAEPATIEPEPQIMPPTTPAESEVPVEPEPEPEPEPNLDLDFRLDDLEEDARPASGTTVAIKVAPPLARVDRFADAGGAPDEHSGAPGDSGLLDDLEQLLPFEDPGSTDRIETETTPIPDIFTPILDATVSEDDLEAMPANIADLERPRNGASAPLEFAGSDVIVREHQDRLRDTTQDARPSRFPAWNKFWNGYLGWEGLGAPSERLVAGKLLARFALFGLIPVLLVALISLPFAGSSFAHIDADYTRSTLLYGRPLAELAPADTTIEIAVGVSVSVQLLAQLRTLYGNYFPDLTAAFVSGDPTPLRDILSSEMYTTYAAQVTQAHAQGWTISFWDSGQLPQTLAFSSVFPSSGPQQAVGWADSLTIIYKDRSGVILSQQDYPVVNVSFGLTNSGWRITNLDLSATVPSPSPAPSAAPSGSLASPAPASGSAPPLI